jgi:riboflavin biosynthesis pyrimidine reductase
VYPEAKELYTHYRTKILHKPVHPLVIIVSGSGKLELDRTIFRTPEVQTLIITTVAGRNLLAMAGAERLSSLQISTIDDAGAGIDPAAILQLLFSKFGVRTLLHEGGPTLFAKFLERALVDELFVTLAPQIAGRLPRTNRPGIVEGVEFLPTTAPWFQLLSIKQKAEHLYLRYCAQGVPSVA